jgi:BirA family transcriptional regulator, biotin operon repressor / biotin---[acetyl-CoA-carboxylase] ligase
LSDEKWLDLKLTTYYSHVPYNMSKALFVGQSGHCFDQLPSTNDYLTQAAHDSVLAEGYVVRTRSQTAGRGQMGATWVAEPDANLTLSVLFRPTWLPVQRQFGWSMAVAVGVHDALQAWLEEYPHLQNMLAIKWPNDLQLGTRKVGGILIQNTLSGNHLSTSVVGIGLNINQLVFPGNLPNATSLALATGRTFDLEQLLDPLYAALERRYLQLRAGQHAALRADYEAHLLGYRTWRNFVRTDDGSPFEGYVLGPTDEGLLRVQHRDGREELFDLKAVRWV